MHPDVLSVYAWVFQTRAMRKGQGIPLSDGFMRDAIAELHSNFRHWFCADIFEQLLKNHSAQLDTFRFRFHDPVLQPTQKGFFRSMRKFSCLIRLASVVSSSSRS